MYVCNLLNEQASSSGSWMKKCLRMFSEVCCIMCINRCTQSSIHMLSKLIFKQKQWIGFWKEPAWALLEPVLKNYRFLLVMRTTDAHKPVTATWWNAWIQDKKKNSNFLRWTYVENILFGCVELIVLVISSK